jgi:hypothetical protein
MSLESATAHDGLGKSACLLGLGRLPSCLESNLKLNVYAIRELPRERSPIKPRAMRNPQCRLNSRTEIIIAHFTSISGEAPTLSLVPLLPSTSRMPSALLWKSLSSLSRTGLHKEVLKKEDG